MAKGVRAIMIVEIAGRPANHVRESLEAHISQLNKSKVVKIIGVNYSEPKKLETEQEMYTCFAEVEIEAVNFFEAVNLIFDFMPSSFEIIEPQNINLNLNEATTLLNTLSGRLHRYDEIAKVAQFQVQQLAYKLNEAQQQNAKKSEVVEKSKKSSKKKKSASD
jgi:hypothetical protein